MKFTQKTWLFLCAAQISCAIVATDSTNFTLSSSYEYDINSSETYFFCIPKIITKHKVRLFDTQQNQCIAQARYVITSFNSTATLKKAHKWFKNKEIRNSFLVLIIKNIKKEYPHITQLEYVDTNEIITWIFIK